MNANQYIRFDWAAKCVLRQKAKLEGRDEGFEEGWEKGIEKGMEKVAIAKSLKEEGLPLSVISKTTGLSLADMEKL